MLKIFRFFFSFFIIFSLFISTGFAESEVDTLDDFKIVSTEVLNFNQIYVAFNYNILEEEGVVRDFRLTNKDDFWDELYTISAELDELNKKMLLLTFDGEAIANGVYELLTVNLLDEFGRNIESGINSIATIQMPNEIIEEIDLNSASDLEPLVEETGTGEILVEETGTGELLIEEIGTGKILVEENEIENEVEVDLNSGMDVGEDFLIKNVESESAEIETLPETGPANLFIFILASILTLLIFVFRFKKL